MLQMWKVLLTSTLVHVIGAVST